MSSYVAKPTPPNQDKRWKLVDATMRRQGQQQRGLIETLHTVQEAFGYLDVQALRYVAMSLRVPLSRAYGVATFYHFFTLKPAGEHTCVICMGTACYIKGAPQLLDAVQRDLGIAPGETTADKKVSLLTARCLGYEEYFPIAERYKVPIVVTGFEPLDILEGILMTVSQLEEGRREVENQYVRATRREGNRPAQERIAEVFEVVNRPWRGLGEIPLSGFQLRGRFQKYDANRRYPSSAEPARESPECISGLILQGIKKPHECPAFAVKCTPENPLGAPMVSSEGACAAYYHYGRRQSHDRIQPELSGTPSR